MIKKTMCYTARIQEILVIALLCALFPACAGLNKAMQYHEAGLYEREIAVLDKLIAKADSAEQPPLLLKRGNAFIASAQQLRMEKSPNPAFGGLFQWPTDSERYEWFYGQAHTDFERIVTVYPNVQEASEAYYMIGVINDYPHCANFLDAIEAYGKTIEKYPGTEAARKAQERKALIEKIYGGITHSPHGGD